MGSDDVVVAWQFAFERCTACCAQVLTSAEYSELKARGQLSRTPQGGWSVSGSADLDGAAEGRPAKRMRADADGDADMKAAQEAGTGEVRRARQHNKRCVVM